MSFEYHGTEFFEGIRERVTIGVGEAANILKDELKELISIQGPPRSKPGESPHKDTGDLYASIEMIGPAVQEDMVVASVGTEIIYGRWLEFGNSQMAARPWLSKGLIQSQEHLTDRIFGK